MDKLNQSKDILKQLDMPKEQQGDMCGLVLLALAEISEEDVWEKSKNNWFRIHDVMGFISLNYGITYAENSRETFRKVAMHHFRNAALIEDNGKATNSPNYKYRITAEALSLLKSYDTVNWQKKLNEFKTTHESLIKSYSSKKKMEKMPVRINSEDFTFSSGKHNCLQKAIIEEFAPRYAPNCLCLYVGDTIKKDLVKLEDKLLELGFNISVHDKMPDVVLYVPEKNWIYFIEAVTSVGAITPARIKEIEDMTKNVKSGKVYITAFPDFKTYKKFSEELAWETEVWLSDMPDHMIHLNGDKFLGPRK